MDAIYTDTNTRQLPGGGELVITQTYSTDPKKPEMTVTLQSTGRELQLDASHQRISNIRPYEQLDAIRERLDDFRHKQDLGVTEVLTPDKHTLVLKSKKLNSQKYSPGKIYSINYELNTSSAQLCTDELERYITGQQFSIKAANSDAEQDRLDVTLFSKSGNIIVEIHTRSEEKKTGDTALKESFALMHMQANEAKRADAISIVDGLLSKLHARMPEEINLHNLKNEKLILTIAGHSDLAGTFSALNDQLQTMERMGLAPSNVMGMADTIMQKRERVVQHGALLSPQLEENIAAILQRRLGELTPERRKTINKEIMEAVTGQRGRGN